MAAQHSASPRKRTNLLQRKQGWYARYYVPKHQQRAFGRAEVQRTLGTRDKLEAHRRLPAVLADLQREVDDAVSSLVPVDYVTEADVLRELDSIEARVRRGDYTDPADPAEVHPADLAVELTVDAHSTRLGAIDPGTGFSSRLSSAVVERAALVRRAIHDPDYRSLMDWTADFIKHLQSRRVKAGTWKTHERRIGHFVQWAGSKRDPRLMGDADAVRYRDCLNSEPELSTRVRKDTAATVRALFEWLRKDRKLIRYNPFADLREAILPNPADPDEDDGRRAWHAEELTTIIGRLNPARPLWSVFVLSLYSGLRINEVCSMRLEHVARRCLNVAPEFAKNDNSVRVVPIHPIIAPLVSKLVSTSFDGYLISGLVPGGQDKRRGAYPSKRFSVHRKTLGLTDADTTFHSTRHNFATAAERSRVPVPTVQKLLGHARQTITLDRYSDGPELTALRKAVDGISYDRAKSEDHAAVTVDALVTSVLDEFGGNHAWRRKNGRDLLPDAEGTTRLPSVNETQLNNFGEKR